ncbi:MAG: response regulator, partial [Candidatus Limnocylindria bacterium]
MSAQAPTLRVLIVEDSPRDAELTVRELRTSGREIAWERVESATTLREALTRGPWDVILCDYQLPGFDALGALALVQASGQDIPCIIVSGAIGEETAVEAMRAGARDYLMKGKLTRLSPVIDREIREARGRADAAAGATAAGVKLDQSRTLLEAFASSLDALIATAVDAGEGGFERSLQFAVDSTREVLGARYAALTVLATARREVASFVHSGIDHETVLRIGAPPTGEGLLGVVIEQGAALRLDDLQADPRAEGFPLHHPTMGMLLAVPVGNPPDVLGRLFLADRLDGTAFTPEDERIAVSFSTLIAAALRHPELIAEIGGSRKQFEGLFRQSPVATVIRRASDAVIYDANDAYAAVTGHARDALVGSTAADLGIFTPEEIERVDATSRGTGLLEGAMLSLHTLSGEIRQVRATTVPTQIDGQPYFIVSLVDVTDQAAAEARRLHDASHDRLSGQLNRRGLVDAVEHAIAEAKGAGASFALMHIDIDRFADVNAGFGYACGDELLQLLGSRLAGTIGE